MYSWVIYYVHVADGMCSRRCRNWQTSKTKDLVLATACGFKSHPPQEKSLESLILMTFFVSLLNEGGLSTADVRTFFEQKRRDS